MVRDKAAREKNREGLRCRLSREVLNDHDGGDDDTPGDLI